MITKRFISYIRIQLPAFSFFCLTPSGVDLFFEVGF